MQTRVVFFARINENGFKEQKVTLKRKDKSLFNYKFQISEILRDRDLPF